MTTLYQLIGRVQHLLNDDSAATWSEHDLEEWLLAGIRDYSIYFPRLVTDSFANTAGLQVEDLPEDFISAVLVEHPTDQDPPQYLTRLARTHPDFWLYDTFYDIEPGRADGTRPGQLYLSRVPDGTESTSLKYYAYHLPSFSLHPLPPDSVTAITIPTNHQHIVEQYAVWMAHVERLNTEIQSPDTTIRLVQQYRQAAQAMEATYRASLQRAMSAHSEGGITGPWRLDIHDRIY